ncbi:T9SS type A sorting domain-containing protein [Aequorivita sp. H23M31]|uniref:T9SS type A sorting domain-containing protein n=1 Tax=Aequorivita ciconiae TaxID=2494375 RepID=A0A410G4R1_9FLAO|nr:T9SS type A sorting domain-containing protein [Aequorivita sp. H23M31]QAA82253.1 T9SS type A sorting domain-containing protein [Aequorivita sp. H23M31]
MKNYTLITFIFLAFCLVAKAQTISFESSEGYVLGDINGQSNWETTSDDQGGNIQNQVITDEAASVGDYSFKIIKESAFSGQPQPLVGGFYNYPTPISNTEATFSADIYINSLQDANALTFLMGLVHFDTEGGKYRTYMNFHHQGYIEVFVTGGPTGIMVDYTGQTWQPQTWYNIRIETSGETVKFFLDNEEIYEGILVSDGPIHQVRFVHDNYDGFIYIDNFRTNNESLSVGNVVSNEITYFYDKNTKSLSLNSGDLPFSEATIFNTLGQEIVNKNLSNREESIDFSQLGDGIYIVKLNIGNQSKTVKVLKN